MNMLGFVLVLLLALMLLLVVTLLPLSLSVLLLLLVVIGVGVVDAITFGSNQNLCDPVLTHLPPVCCWNVLSVSYLSWVSVVHAGSYGCMLSYHR